MRKVFAKGRQALVNEVELEIGLLRLGDDLGNPGGGYPGGGYPGGGYPGGGYPGGGGGIGRASCRERVLLGV